MGNVNYFSILLLSVLDFCTPNILNATTQREEMKLADIIANLLVEMSTTHYGSCHHIILSNPAEYTYMEEARKQQMSGVSLSYDWNHLENPPPSYILHFIPSDENNQNFDTFEGRAEKDFCVTFFVLTAKAFLLQLRNDISKLGWFPGATRHFVIVVEDEVSQSEMSLIFKDISLIFNMVFIVPNHIKNNETIVKIIGMCHFCNGGESGPNIKGYWKESSGLSITSSLIEKIPKDFENHKFTCRVLDDPLYLRFYKESEKIVLKDCLDKRLFDTLGSFYNFIVEAREPLDCQWGNLYDNGSYDGIIGSVAKRESDFSTSIILSWQRSFVLSFSMQYVVDPLTIVVPKPKILPYWTTIIKPFQGKTWLCFILTIFFAGPIFVFLQRSQNCDVENSRNGYTQLSLELFGTLLSQHFEWKLNNSSIWFVGSFLLFVFTVNKLYVMALASYLTIPTYSPVINSLEELVRSDFSWGVENDAAADVELFKTSKVKLYQDIYSKMEFCPSDDECFLRVAKGRYCFIFWKQGARLLIAQQFKDASGEPMVLLAKEEFYPSGVGFGLPKGSILKIPFDAVIIRLLEAGIVEFWISELTSKKDSTINSTRANMTDLTVHSEQPVRINMQHLEGIFIAYAVGIALSLFTILVEVAVYKVKSSRFS